MSVQSSPSILSRPVTVQVDGMSCASCTGRVEAALRALPGVAEAGVNLATGRATTRFAGAADVAAVVQAVTTAGFTVPDQTTTLGVEGLSCASCVSRAETTLRAVAGVTDASVNLATGRATVHFPAGAVSDDDLRSAIEAVGFKAELGARPAETRTAGHDRTQARLARDLLAAAVLTLPLMVLDMGAHGWPAMPDMIIALLGPNGPWAVQAVLALAVLAGPGRRFFLQGMPALWRRHPDMNALVALGTGAAAAYSLAALLAPGAFPPGTAQVYFEPAALIVTLVLLGRFLEARARTRTGDAIRRLLALAPETARRLQGEGEITVPVSVLAVGDVLRLRPGERVPTDAIVVAGTSYLDEGMITGEPVPVAKAPGDAITGGTVNTTGSLDIRVTGVGADTALARIVALVEAAQGAKLPIQAAADRVTAVFVPAVLGVAAVTFLAWIGLGPAPALPAALVNAVAVLVIACPCAMGLATPVAVMAGTGRAAELGVLFRGGDALQHLHDIRRVALDKTGTLTEGRPRVTTVLPVAGMDADEVLRLAASVETRSEHPLGRAIVTAAEARGLALAAPEAFEAVPGFGVTATVAGRRVVIGADRFLAGQGIAAAALAPEAERLGREGASPLLVAVDGRLAAVIGVADPIREGAPAAVAALKRLGLSVAMITGDNARTAGAVAARLGIPEVVADVPPAGKVEALRRWRAAGRIAFVGDGINDAPALAEADVGIAVGTGSDIAIESAGVVLMRPDLAALVRAIELSRATLRVIRQNLFWAFAYNVALIPVAAGVLAAVGGPLLSPVLAAGAMALSSLFVVLNALRLRRFGRATRASAGPRTSALEARTAP